MKKKILWLVYHNLWFSGAGKTDISKKIKKKIERLIGKTIF